MKGPTHRKVRKHKQLPKPVLKHKRLRATTSGKKAMGNYILSGHAYRQFGYKKPY